MWDGCYFSGNSMGTTGKSDEFCLGSGIPKRGGDFLPVPWEITLILPQEGDKNDIPGTEISEKKGREVWACSRNFKCVLQMERVFSGSEEGQMGQVERGLRTVLRRWYA